MLLNVMNDRQELIRSGGSVRATSSRKMSVGVNRPSQSRSWRTEVDVVAVAEEAAQANEVTASSTCR